jgi:ATP-dependent helicase HrpB
VQRTALPIDALLPEIVAALRTEGALVIEAPPGAGKTTRVPAALLDAGLVGDKSITVLEPRRIAARLSARRVAAERGERVGETVGYTVRFEDVGGPRTRLRYVTEGILTRQLLSDPELRGVGAVVLDEFHERHIHSDVALALLQRLQRRARRDLKLVVMSATLDAAGLADHLGCRVLRSEGRMYPVEVEHLEAPDDRRVGDQAAAAVRRITVPGTEGHVLVFLPGAGEIRQTQDACAEIAAHRGLSLLPLHGDLPPDEQDRVLAPSRDRKVILATNVAETSVTIEGVTAVIDTGLARVASHSPWSGLPRLEVSKISRASATQRAGRAGRTAPGRCLRLYTKGDFDSRPDHHAPELLRVDLAETVLSLRAAGLDPDALPWLDPPPPGALHTAHHLLRQLGALGSDGNITGAGRAAARLPLHPRLARLLMEAQARGIAGLGCAVAALLGERDLRIAARLRTSSASGTSDIDELLAAFLEARRVRFAPDRLRAQGVDAGSARRVERAREQLAHLVSAPDALREPTPAEETSLRVAALAAFPDRVCKRRAAGSQELTLAAGAPARLSDQSCVREAGLLVAIDAEERRDAPGAQRGPPGRGGTLVRIASAIEPDWLLDLFANDLRETTEPIWEPQRERVEVLSRLSYGSLVLEESRRPPRLDGGPEAEQAARLLLSQLRSGSSRALDPALQAAVDELRTRVELVASHCPDAGLRRLEDADVEAALLELALGRASLSDLREADLPGALVQRLGPEAASKLARLAPEHVALASGRRLRVEYAPGQPPAVRSRLQDFFGSARGPSICAGRVPLVLHLLAPSGRAQQVTSDLEGFWSRHYPAIRKELMRKYPRHSWPEDGRTAAPPAPRR